MKITMSFAVFLVSMIGLTSMATAQTAPDYTYDVSYACFLSDIEFKDGEYNTRIANDDGMKFQDRLVWKSKVPTPLGGENTFASSKEIVLQPVYYRKVTIKVDIFYYRGLDDTPSMTLTYVDGDSIITSESYFVTGKAFYDNHNKSVGFSVIKKNIGGFRVVCSTSAVDEVKLK